MGNYPTKVYLNGEILDHDEACISVFDRGFLFGDGIYEVMVQLNGSFFFERQHLQRLNKCLGQIGITYAMDMLPELINALLSACDLEKKDCLLYIQVTRGVAPRKHAYPADTEPTIMMYAIPFKLPDINNKHLEAITLPDHRWARCDIKMTSLLGNIMANDAAVKQGAYEAILIRDGMITEASHSNVFFIKNDVVYTHPADEYILDGVTRQLVIKLCHDLGVEVIEKAVHQAEVTQMDEAFLTGTTTQVASLKRLDDHYFYHDEGIGPMTKRLQNAFLELKKGFAYNKNNL